MEVLQIIEFLKMLLHVIEILDINVEVLEQLVPASKQQLLYFLAILEDQVHILVFMGFAHEPPP